MRVSVHRTAGRGDGARIAAGLSACGPGTTLIVVGGDGSLNDVANGLLDSGIDTLPTLLIYPVGSGNDFARHLGVPRGAQSLLECLSAGAVRRVDAWQLAWPAGHRWFVNVASFGFTGAAAAIIDRRGKRFGGMSYAVGGLLALAGHRDRPVRVEVPGRDPEEGLLGAGVLANAPWFGSRMHVAPGADSGDGRLDLLTVRGAGRLRLVGLMAGVYLGRHMNSASVSRWQIPSVRLAWNGDLAFEADGEPVPATSPVEVSARRGGLCFRVPPARKR